MESIRIDGHKVRVYLDGDGDYLAHFADMPTIWAYGVDRDEALDQLRKAWRLYQESEDGWWAMRASVDKANAARIRWKNSRS